MASKAHSVSPGLGARGVRSGGRRVRLVSEVLEGTPLDHLDHLDTRGEEVEEAMVGATAATAGTGVVAP